MFHILYSGDCLLYWQWVVIPNMCSSRLSTQLEGLFIIVPGNEAENCNILLKSERCGQSGWLFAIRFSEMTDLQWVLFLSHRCIECAMAWHYHSTEPLWALNENIIYKSIGKFEMLLGCWYWFYYLDPDQILAILGNKRQQIHSVSLKIFY